MAVIVLHYGNRLIKYARVGSRVTHRISLTINRNVGSPNSYHTNSDRAISNCSATTRHPRARHRATVAVGYGVNVLRISGDHYHLNQNAVEATKGSTISLHYHTDGVSCHI